jgi:hypothetical protein
MSGTQVFSPAQLLNLFLWGEPLRTRGVRDRIWHNRGCSLTRKSRLAYERWRVAAMERSAEWGSRIWNNGEYDEQTV